jgi:hypothetical protein
MPKRTADHAGGGDELGLDAIGLVTPDFQGLEPVN